MLRRITDEMRHYMRSGCCPYCGAAILNGAYNLLNDALNLTGGGNGLNAFERLRLAPGGAKVTYSRPNTFTCGWCREVWNIWGDMTPSEVRALLFSARNPRQNVSAASSARTPAQFRLTRLSKLERVKYPARTESHVMRNGSAATVTGSHEFAWAVARTVTVDHHNVTVQGTQGGLNFAGFASLGKTLSDEVRRSYSVTSRAELSRKHTVAVPVPPYSAIEVVLTWEIVQEPGWGLFTGAAGEVLHMPFTVDMDLLVNWTTRDVY
ncbi:hypothetical protein SAMN06272735_4621 [Streptomyces sp. TLI_55]|uniref:hypothetical protein n=1 Tax=Streptomyces sp. TLI_55 TaxID=1938861 RepID=UPI000BC66154|nr:hypothetical protein [Streptomyces sp. TLI_55]SNX62831.1 hypothetical protein SAMN06272735_4621 [Streptomyces sp. TLI_55]